MPTKAAGPRCGACLHLEVAPIFRSNRVWRFCQYGSWWPAGRAVLAKEARTSPQWCPLKAQGEGAGTNE
jgi:hypothetical protein